MQLLDFCIAIDKEEYSITVKLTSADQKTENSLTDIILYC